MRTIDSNISLEEKQLYSFNQERLQNKIQTFSCTNKEEKAYYHKNLLTNLKFIPLEEQ